MNQAHQIAEFAKMAIRGVYEIVIRGPFRRLWLKGPWLGGFGFWNGRDPAFICSHLSFMPMSEFADRPASCQALMEMQFDSFMVACEFAIYVLVLYALLRTIFTLAFYHIWWWSLKRKP